MYTRDDMQDYRCPRWNDWPGLDLYMDQVISLLEEYVAIFYTDEQPKPVTSTMINNYVKQKIVSPSRNKKYSREHLAILYVVFLLKPVLSLTDICGVISCLNKRPSAEDAYNAFCSGIEAALSAAFEGNNEPDSDATNEHEIIHTVSLAFAYTLLARLHISADLKKEKPIHADEHKK